MRPISASDALRQVSPRKLIGSTFNTVNRFSFLRDISPAPPLGTRGRSVSNKRKNSSELSYAAATSKSIDPPTISPDSGTVLLQENLAKVRSLCDTIEKDLGDLQCDPAILLVLGKLCEAVRLTNNAQISLANTPVEKNVNLPIPSLGAIPKRPRSALASNNNGFLSQPAPTVSARDSSLVRISNPDPLVPPEIIKFKEAVKDAERSTLIFNLNLGSVPILNTETMSKRSTLALTSMAAATEGNHGNLPSQDSISAIDDILSVTKKIEFFGKSTKTYQNVKDPLSGSFCTIPVKYEFNDKDTRIKAESTLRARCKVHCSTPYPIILRECIKQTHAHFRGKYPGDFFRVNVDASKQALRVFRKPAGENTSWVELERDIYLPPEALNVTARSVPNGFLCLICHPQVSRRWRRIHRHLAGPQQTPDCHGGIPPPNPPKNSSTGCPRG